MNNNSSLATAIHWPECWDTAAYPTFESALSEVYAFFRCSECAPTLVEPQGESAVETVAVFDWLCRTYIQRADRRQRSMGLQYTMAETHELACAISNHFAGTSTQQFGPVDDATIRDVFLRNGFTIKEGQTDLMPYVYAAARELISTLIAPNSVSR